MPGRFDYDGYDDEGAVPYGLWKHAEDLALKGRPGQRALRELEAALLAMPERRLISGYLVETANGDVVGVCAIGALAAHREAEQQPLDFDEAAMRVRERFGIVEDQWELGDTVAPALKLTRSLVWAVASENDEVDYMTPEERWEHMLGWVRRQLIEEKTA